MTEAANGERVLAQPGRTHRHRSGRFIRSPSAGYSIVVAASSLVAATLVVGGRAAALIGGAGMLAGIAWTITHRDRATMRVLPALLLLPQFIPGLPFSIVAWGVLFVTAVDGFRRHRPRLPLSVRLPLGAFLLYALGTMIFGSSQPAMTGMVLVLFSLPLLLVVANVDDRRRVNDLLDSIVWSGIILAVMAIAERLRGSYLISDDLTTHLARERFGQLRAQATLPHPIALGLILAMVSVLALGRIISGRRSMICPLILMTVAIVSTYSRAPLVLVCGAAVTMTLVLVGSRQVRRLSIAIGLAAIVIIASPLRHDVAALADSLRNEASASEAGSAIQSRVLINNAIAEFVREHPGGVGFYGLTDRTIPAYGPTGSFNAARSVDNTYLLAMAELGWIGGLLLVALLAINAARATMAARRWRRDPDLGPLLASIAGVQVGFILAAFTVATVTTWGQVSLAYWLTVGLGIATERVAAQPASIQFASRSAVEG